jgi:hypothetical protein
MQISAPEDTARFDEQKIFGEIRERSRILLAREFATIYSQFSQMLFGEIVSGSAGEIING